MLQADRDEPVTSSYNGGRRHGCPSESRTTGSQASIMKYAIILPDGAADEPVELLDGITPLEAARTPNMDWVSSHGRQGRVVTVPKGFSPGSDVATLSLFGYDARHDYDGRAPLEAAARGITARPGQLIFRCNLVTIVDGVMADFTAGHITNLEAEQLINDLNEMIGSDSCRFHPGVSYRNLMVATPPGGLKATCTPPHDIPDQPIKKHLPKGTGADWLRTIMLRAHDLLGAHDVNHVRADLGDNPATDIWLWGYGKPTTLQSFEERYGVRGACIAAVDLIRGIAKSVGMTVIDVDGATGYLDTDYAAKGKAGVAALDEYDLVVVHVEAPDEAGHLGDAEAKVAAIEKVDEYIVGPMLEKLRTFDEWKLLVAPDHPTPVEKRTHTSDPPPFCVAGSSVHSVLRRPFSEKAAVTSDLQIDPGYELMEYFLKA